jgi:hypothetical protein
MVPTFSLANVPIPQLQGVMYPRWTEVNLFTVLAYVTCLDQPVSKAYLEINLSVKRVLGDRLATRTSRVKVSDINLAHPLREG